MTEPDVHPLLAPDNPEEMAAFWFSRRRTGTMTAQEAREHEVWLARDPLNRAAFDAVQAFWREVEAVRADPTVLALREEALGYRPGRSRALKWSVAAASLLLAAVGAGVAVKVGPLADLLEKPVAQEYRTGVGQTVRVNLPDGSTATLDTDTVIRATLTRKARRIELAQGQAFFHVAKDAARPFIVSAADKTVTATGTAFDVRIDPGRFMVTLIQGRVRVEAPDANTVGGAFSHAVRSADMTAGSRLTARDDQRWTVSTINPRKETGWLRGQLIFTGESLGEVVAELNRYSTKKIVVADPGVERTPISGSFPTGDVRRFVWALKDYRMVRVASESDAEVRLIGRRGK